jgi:hypothetical protein
MPSAQLANISTMGALIPHMKMLLFMTVVIKEMHIKKP